jgi:hypothetical protein
VTDIRPIHEQHSDAVLDARAAYLRGEDFTYRQIASEMDCSVSTAHARVNRAYGRMAGPRASERRSTELKNLEDMERIAWQVLERSHVVVQLGKVVKMVVDGVAHPIPDDAPILSAIDRLLKIQERRAHLMGIDAPARRSVEVITKDALHVAMDRMNAEMAAMGFEDEDEDDLEGIEGR